MEKRLAGYPFLQGTMTSDSSRSASTSRKSKRSFDSVLSNDPANKSGNSGSSNNKKKNSRQKTLGVAWGANSLASARSSSRKSPFSDFGSYMVEKNRKLQQQFDAAASTSVEPIFQGVSIFVDGFTIPSSQELRGYMLKYGGRFENYFSRRSVTHIICSNLPDSKLKNLRSFSRGLPVVKPTWILDSVAAKRLLNWLPYQIDQLTDSQPKLSAFFAPRSCQVAEESLRHTFCESNEQSDDPSMKSAILLDANSSEVGESIEQGKKMEEEFDWLHEYAGATSEKPIGAVKTEVNPQEATFLGSKQERLVDNEFHPSIKQPFALIGNLSQHNETDRVLPNETNEELHSETNEELHNETNRDLPTSTVSGSSRRSHSTLEDPNFVENYFKNSRLHFIGTWRNRYRKRFPGSSGFRSTGSEQSLSTKAKKPVILHIDLDCFFVSVVIRNQPELQEKPVAVCHSDNPKGTAEISSANYPARSYGIKAGMFVRGAKALCPHLVILPYNFEAYEKVADQFYDILHRHCSKVQAVSCDEAFLDVTDSGCEDPERLALTIRNEILEVTGCSASAGIAGNMLMARLATRTAKPAGQCYIPEDKVDEYMHELPISALPGIGHVLEEKLRKQNVRTCGQLRAISKDSLQKEFGMKTGEMLWNYSRGLDHRHVRSIQESKTICAEVNWGVRFRDQQDAQSFLLSLCKEVSLRLQACGVVGRAFTLKMKKRRKDAEEPTKYMGCGECENLSRSFTVPIATDEVEVLQRISKQLFASFPIDVKDVRGLGLQVSKLEDANASNKGLERSYMKSWLTSLLAGTEEKYHINRLADAANADFEGDTAGISCQLGSDPVESSAQTNNNAPSNSNSEAQLSHLPPLSNLDMEVVESLPAELFSELDETYGGKLVEFIERYRCRNDATRNSSNSSPHISREDAMVGKKGALRIEPSSLNTFLIEKTSQDFQPPIAGPCIDAIPSSGVDMADIMPTSFSQVDTSVLQQLPEEVRADILDALPAHRNPASGLEASSGAAMESNQNIPDIIMTENKSDCILSVSVDSLWVGSPPLWVEKFKASGSYILKTFAEMYYKSTEKLSSILVYAMSECTDPQSASSDGWNEAIDDFCELLKQYAKQKIEADIEEIYVCLRLLKRLSTKSRFFLEVYDIIFPFLQASVGENYGGSLNIS